MSRLQWQDFIDAPTSDGKTALMIATMRGWHDIANLLCSVGASMDIQDRTEHSTSLHWAGAASATWSLVSAFSGLVCCFSNCYLARCSRL